MFTADGSDDESDVHSIANLALLACGANSALNNAVFEVKRSRIMEMDRRASTSRPAPATFPEVLHRRSGPADPLLEPARPRGLPGGDGAPASGPTWSQGTEADE